MKEKFPNITIILRGYSKDASVRIAEILNEYRCFALEIALNSEGALDTIKAIKDRKLNDVIVGAGTVTSKELLIKAHKAGADFVLSPVTMSYEMLDYCRFNNIISVPGAYSPSEIFSMADGNADIIKIFPASTLQMDYFKAVQAPLGKLQLMAVGGVNPDNVETFFKNGVQKVGIGSGIGHREDMESGNFDEFRVIIDKLSKVNCEHNE